MAAFAQWEILLAWIPNSDGSPPPYPHPCIYLGDSQRRPNHIVVLGITSDLTQRDAQFSVDLPWSANGHVLTGLDRPSLAQTHWTDHIPEMAVRSVIGETPPEQRELIARRLAMRSPKRTQS